ncbi:MSHA biogenesis protein MshJ [Shewanella sp. Scap07]|uniref:MSHA biogenesis protein MshJ n=1 Tax=Shewanella sp. Scap07 TaxID=2589987 RepID=UPI0015BECDFE|nr:MSHA biogenesis protein MshJ [Shewanella sp. Scap07]QLE87091.1 MSHA biogenesis protein MshJ [Shewanella sp. Scap07]
MKQLWLSWGEKFDVLTQRERGMIAAAALIVIGMLCYLPLESKLLERQKLQRSISALQNENKVSAEQVALYQQQLALDPNTDYRQRLQAIEEQTQALDEQLTFQMVDMVPADKMPVLLSELLGKVKGVKLQEFASIAPVPLLEVGEQDKKLNLYSHGIRLVLQGDYFATLKFIEAVEAMPNKLYWKQLDYTVADYPDSSVVLELYTLSINKDFISVAKSD